MPTMVSDRTIPKSSATLLDPIVNDTTHGSFSSCESSSAVRTKWQRVKSNTVGLLWQPVKNATSLWTHFPLRMSIKTAVQPSRMRSNVSRNAKFRTPVSMSLCLCGQLIRWREIFWLKFPQLNNCTFGVGPLNWSHNVWINAYTNTYKSAEASGALESLL